MRRGPLYTGDYQPRLSGHETFPLRYGWLKKAFDAVSVEEGGADGGSIFSREDAIAHFGVGKNMVASMRHWATSTGILNRHLAPTPLGHLVFGRGGLDPYMEDAATSWLAHWHIAGHADKTTWFWAFNHFPALTFQREMLIRGVAGLVDERGWQRASPATIKRDVSCFVRTYVPRPVSRQASYEDSLESPLTELGLIRPTGGRDRFRFVRGPKPSLGAGVFGFAVTEFWKHYSRDANTLSFEALAHEPGSPGRVFVLDENALINLLGDLEVATRGVYRWSETAGLKQLIRPRPLTGEEQRDLVKQDYGKKAA